MVTYYIKWVTTSWTDSIVLYTSTDINFMKNKNKDKPVIWAKWLTNKDRDRQRYRKTKPDISNQQTNIQTRKKKESLQYDTKIALMHEDRI